MSRIYVLVPLAILAALVVAACNSDSGGNGGGSDGDEKEYFTEIVEIALRVNEVSRLVVMMEFGDEEVASNAEELRRLTEKARDIMPPDAYSEPHQTVVEGMETAASNAELAVAAIEAGDEPAFEEALTAVNEAQRVILDGLLVIRRR